MRLFLVSAVMLSLLNIFPDSDVKHAVALGIVAALVGTLIALKLLPNLSTYVVRKVQDKLEG